MTAHRILLTGLLLLAGCPTVTDLTPDGGNCVTQDMKGSENPDMTAPVAKCAAAKGLAGDNLLCVDFDKVTALSTLSGWDFTSQCPAGWTVSGGKLQVNSFATFMGDCRFTMPALGSADYQKYNGFTLSIVQSLDLNKTQLRQSAVVYLGVAIDTQQVWLGTGNSPRQTSAITVAKTALPNGGAGMYQPLFQVVSGVAGGGFQGWLIESIAVNGVQ